MRGCLKTTFLSIALAAAVLASLGFWALRHSLPPMPKLLGNIERGALEHGGRVRTCMGMTSISLRINMVSLPFIRRATKVTGTIAA